MELTTPSPHPKRSQLIPPFNKEPRVHRPCIRPRAQHGRRHVAIIPRRRASGCLRRARLDDLEHGAGQRCGAPDGQAVASCHRACRSPRPSANAPPRRRRRSCVRLRRRLVEVRPAIQAKEWRSSSENVRYAKLARDRVFPRQNAGGGRGPTSSDGAAAAARPVQGLATPAAGRTYHSVAPTPPASLLLVAGHRSTMPPPPAERPCATMGAVMQRAFDYDVRHAARRATPRRTFNGKPRPRAQVEASVASSKRFAPRGKDRATDRPHECRRVTPLRRSASSPLAVPTHAGAAGSNVD